MKLIAWNILSWLALVTTSQAASFDCLKASTKIEKLICDNVELSKLDEDLSKAYLLSLQRSDVKQKAVQSQREWLRDRRNTCESSECLKKAYETRIKEVGLMSSFGIVILSAPTDKKALSSPSTKQAETQTLVGSSRLSKEVIKQPRIEAANLDLDYTVVAHYPSRSIRAVTVNKASGLIAIANTYEAPVLLKSSDSNKVMHIAGPLDDEDNRNAFNMFFNNKGSLLYVGNECRYEKMGCGGIVIIDTQSPLHARVQAEYGGQGVTAIALSSDEKILFFGDEGIEGNASLVILDVTNPVNPIELGRVKTIGQIRSILASKESQFAFLTTDDIGLQIVDVTNPRNPVVVGGRDIPGAGSVVASSTNRIAYVSSYGAVTAVDVSDPHSPKPINSIYDSEITTIAPMFLRAGDSHLYVMTSDRGVIVLDVSVPAKISLIGIIRIPKPSQTFQFYVSDDEQMIYIPTADYDDNDTNNVGGLDVYQRRTSVTNKTLQ